MVTVIIPAYNEEQILPTTLKHWARVKSQLGDKISEIIVVDNASTDATGQMAKDAGFRVICEARQGIARARNAGARAATGEILLFVDADTWPSVKLISTARELLATGHLYVGTQVQFDERITWHAACVLQMWNWVSETLGWMAGAFMMLRKDSWERVGGLDESLLIGEELDFARRLKKLARSEKRKPGRIIRNLPVRTSARKLRDFSVWETLQLTLPLLIRPTKRVRDIRYCAYWYKRK